jgi:NADH-quinone oxidoreductase subunit E
MRKFTKNSDDRALGAAVVSTVFAAIGAGMGTVMWGFDVNQTGATFIVLLLLIFLVLSLGWRELPEDPPGTKKAPTVSDHDLSNMRPSPPTPDAPSTSSGPSASASAPSSGTAPAAASSAATDAATSEDRTSDSGSSDSSAAEAAPAAPEPGPGSRPAALDGPRNGQPDDLKQIKGVGPALEKLCNSLGFYHFDQIAAWTPQEVEWVDQNLEGFKGRVTRDNWVDQAKALARGEEPPEPAERGAASS